MATSPTPQPALIPAPTASISASPSVVDAGRSATLTWSAQNTTSVSIDNGIGDVAATGTASVTPSGPTTYTLTAKGPGGLQQAVVQVGWNPPPKPLYIIVILPPDMNDANAVLAKARFDGYPKFVTSYVLTAPSGVGTAFAIFSA